MNRLLLSAAALLAFALPQLLAAQTYPGKPIRVTIPYPAGGSGDVVGRTIGGTPERLAQRTKSDYVKWGKVVKDIGLKAE